MNEHDALEVLGIKRDDVLKKRHTIGQWRFGVAA